MATCKKPHSALCISEKGVGVEGKNVLFKVNHIGSFDLVSGYELNKDVNHISNFDLVSGYGLNKDV